MRRVFFHEETRAEFVARHLVTLGYRAEVDGTVMLTDAPKAVVRATPDGVVNVCA